MAGRRLILFGLSPLFFVLFFRFIKASDIGLISFFETKCPEGWIQYTRSACRMIVFAGAYTEPGWTKGSCLEDELGGEYSHQLKLDEMASHSHIITAEGRHGRDMGFADKFYSSWGENSHEVRSKLSDPKGGNQPHNNVPPYIVLNACKKNQDTVTNYDSFVEFGRLKGYTSLEDLKSLHNKLFAINNNLANISDLAWINQYITLYDIESKNIVKKNSISDFTSNLSRIEKSIQNFNISYNQLKSTFLEISSETSSLRSNLNPETFIGKDELNRKYTDKTYHQNYINSFHPDKFSDNSEEALILAWISASLSSIILIVSLITYCLIEKKKSESMN